MKISVTKKHIDAGRLSNGRTPIELAVMDLDCFEEVELKADDITGYLLEIDGLNINLSKQVQKALSSFFERQEMKPISFDLPIGSETNFSEDDLFMTVKNDFDDDDDDDFDHIDFGGGDMEFGFFS